MHAAIGSVSLVLTESLHGAIFADTMGIPWTPFVTSRNVSALKWVDWTLSVGLDFAPVPLPPPSASAALAFGRPDRGAADGRLHFDAETAMTEFRQRVAMHGAAPPAQPKLSQHARSLLHGAARNSRVVSRTMGFGPGRTAAHLVEAARLAPQLSAPAHRADLRSAMLERLHAFERSQLTPAAAAG